MVTRMGLPASSRGIPGMLTGPSPSPAKVFMASNDFCASVGSGCSVDIFMFCTTALGASDCAAADSGSEQASKPRVNACLYFMIVYLLLVAAGRTHGRL